MEKVRYLPPNNFESEVTSDVPFPLVVLVAYIHARSTIYKQFSFSLATSDIFLIASKLISHNIITAAVPTFFMLSGYLSFLNVSTLSFSVYKDNLTADKKSALLPRSNAVQISVIYAATITAVIALFLNNFVYHIFALRIFAFLGVFATLYLMALTMNSGIVKKLLCVVSPPVFCAYALHTVYIINGGKDILSWTSGMLIPWIPSEVLHPTGYISVPLFCIGICISVFHILRRPLSGAAKTLAGGKN